MGTCDVHDEGRESPHGAGCPGLWCTDSGQAGGHQRPDAGRGWR